MPKSKTHFPPKKRKNKAEKEEKQQSKRKRLPWRFYQLLVLGL